MDHPGKTHQKLSAWRMLALPALIAAALLGSGCVYRMNIQQGNYLDEETIAQVNAGMTRRQVRFLLGTPMVDDPFHDNRWDYVYYLRLGKSRRTELRHFVVHFDGDEVLRTEREIGYD